MKELLALKVSHQQKRVLKAFLQQAPSAGNYVLQSGATFGVLKQMMESFETNLASVTTEKNKSEADFQSMKAAKQEEIKAAQDKVFTMRRTRPCGPRPRKRTSENPSITLAKVA